MVARKLELEIIIEVRTEEIDILKNLETQGKLEKLERLKLNKLRELHKLRVELESIERLEIKGTV